MLATLLRVVLSAGAAGAFTLGPPPPAQVRRVVTVAPSLTELVVALGKGRTLVGVSRFDELAEVKALPRVGGWIDPSVEAVVRLKPDLVLVQPGPGNRQPVEKMAELGVPVLALPMESISDVTQAMRRVGAALHAEREAEALSQKLEQTRVRVRAAAKALGPVRVLFVYGFEPLVVAGPGSFADELLADAGGVNAATGAKSAYTVYSVERAVMARPELIVDASDDATRAKDTLAALPGFKAARWMKIPTQDLLHPGPRLGEGLEQLFRMVHPEAAAKVR